MKIKSSNIIVVMLALSCSAHAVIVGDKNWLQVVDTTGYSYNDFNSIFNKATGKCDPVLCQIGDLDLKDYTWASNDDVNNLLALVTGLSFSSFDDDVSLIGTELNTTNPIFTLFSPTYAGPAPNSGDIGDPIVDVEYVGGLTRTGNSNYGTTIEIINYYDARIADHVAFEKHYDPTRIDTRIGGWFYTTVVPVPASIYLFISGLLSFLYVARGNKQ